MTTISLRLALRRIPKPLCASVFLTRVNMSTGSALPHQVEPSAKPHQQFSDIGKMKTEADGSFKRKASTFRNFITQDGEFTPEKGE